MPFSAFGQGVYFARPAASVPTDYPSQVLSDSPVVYYRLGESVGDTATDSSGNGNHGTYVGGGNITFSASGATTDGDTAITRSGSSIHAVESVNAPVTPGSNPFTIEIWIKKSSAPGSTMIVVGKYSGSGDDLWMGLNSTGKPVLSIGATSIVGGTTITDNTWRHVVGVKDGTDLRIYVNGVSDATPVAFTGTTSPGGNLAIGSYRNGGGFYFHSGSLDEFAFYMSALSSTRVAAHYADR